MEQNKWDWERCTDTWTRKVRSIISHPASQVVGHNILFNKQQKNKMQHITKDNPAVSPVLESGSVQC